MGINAIPIEKIVLLAKFYKTSIDYLLSLTDERIPYKETILNNKKELKTIISKQ